MFLLDIDMYDYGPPTSAADNQEESSHERGKKKEKKTPNQEKEPVPDVSPGGIVRHKLDLAFLISAISC